MRTTPEDDMADVYTSWQYGKKELFQQGEGKQDFYVLLKDVHKPQEFVDQFNSKIGKQIGDGYDKDTQGNIIKFTKASTDADNNVQVIGTINISAKNHIQINIPSYESVSGVVDTKPILRHIGTHAIPILEESLNDFYLHTVAPAPPSPQPRQGALLPPAVFPLPAPAQKPY
eukprot:Platyproteum_vivax@DN7443_c0_g2_i10.p1